MWISLSGTKTPPKVYQIHNVNSFVRYKNSTKSTSYSDYLNVNWFAWAMVQKLHQKYITKNSHSLCNYQPFDDSQPSLWWFLGWLFHRGSTVHDHAHYTFVKSDGLQSQATGIVIIVILLALSHLISVLFIYWLCSLRIGTKAKFLVWCELVGSLSPVNHIGLCQVVESKSHDHVRIDFWK